MDEFTESISCSFHCKVVNDSTLSTIGITRKFKRNFHSSGAQTNVRWLLLDFTALHIETSESYSIGYYD